MGSLAGCLKHARISGDEETHIRRLVKQYRDDGVDGPAANIQAVKELIRETESERASVRAQVREQMPEQPTAILANALRDAADKIEGKPQQVAASKKPTRTANADLSDVGSKIGGARKDKWAERGLTLADLEGMTGGEEAKHIIKANIWKPDYAAMVESGTEPKAAALVKIIYDRLAAKPDVDTTDGRRHYLMMMGHVRAAMQEVNTLEDVKGVRDVLRDRLELPKPGDMRGTNRQDRDILQPKFDTYNSVIRGREDPFYVDYGDRSKADKMVAEGFPNQEAWTRRYSLTNYGGEGLTEEGKAYYQAKGGTWAIVEKGSKKIVAWSQDEASAKAEAQRRYEDKSADTDTGIEPARPHLDDLQREGEDYRKGKNVTAEDFRTTFGFRAIEFGNYAASDERQKHIDQAYDALMDMANTLGISPKAVSLNGTLALAFGARGTRFAAHYESSKMVINITKINGPGALAHEWGHALDHYFGELDRPDAYKGKARGASGWDNMGRYTGAKQRLENLRPEMSAAFDKVMDALFARHKTQAEAIRDAELNLEKIKGDIAKWEKSIAGTKEKASTPPDRMTTQWLEVNEGHLKTLKVRTEVAGKLLADLNGTPKPDGGYGRVETSFSKAATTLSGPTGDYWKRPTEMFARSFEAYVFDRVSGKNDYLVHGVEADKFTKEKGYKENPYPAGTEREAINSAFNKLFDTMQTKETDTGTALFDERTESAPGAPTMEQFKQAWETGVRIEPTSLKIIDSSQQFPQEMMAELASRPYVRKIVASLRPVFSEMARVFKDQDPGFGSPSLVALSPDDYYTGVNLRGPDGIILNPWGALFKAQQDIQSEGLDPEQTHEYVAANILKTMVHELTHQQVEEHDAAFDRQLQANYNALGEDRLERLQQSIMTALEGETDALRRDLDSQTPYWQDRTGLPDENRSSDAESRPIFNSEDVADTGGREGPRSRNALREGREQQAASLDARPTFQRRGADSAVSEQSDTVGTIDPTTARERLSAAKTSVRPYLLGALGLQQIADVYGREHHEVSSYNSALQTMQSDFVQTTQVSDKILKDWDKLKIPVADQMAKVMEDARFANFDPDPVKQQPAMTPAQVALKQRFKDMPEESKAVYRAARDYYSELAESRFQAIKDRINRAGGEPSNRKRLIDRLELAYEKTKAKVYFPFTRFGDYVVKAVKMENGKELRQQREVLTFNSPDEANKFAMQMKARGYKVKQTTKKGYSQDRDAGASTAVREMMDIIEEMPEQQLGIPGVLSNKRQLLEALDQTFLQALPDMSYAKHFIHAKEVKGASRDALRSFAHSALHGAHHISRIRYADRLSNAVLDLDKRINKTEEGDVTEARQVYNELVQRHNAILNPNTHPFSAWLGQLGFTMSLGGVVATGVTNMTQVPLITLPWLGSRYGFGKSTAALGKAYKDFLDPKTLNKDSLFDASKSASLPQEERSMLEWLQKRGRIDLTQTMDLSGRASQDNLSRVAKQTGSIQATITHMLGFTFHAPEVANRQVTALATFRLAKQAGSTYGEALAKAEQAIVETHFIYDSPNRARYMSGNVLRVLTMFKQYSQNVAYLYGRSAQVWLDSNNATKEERAIARKQLLSMLGLQFAAAGALGMPFVGTVASLLTAVLNGFGDDDDKLDWEVELRNFLAASLGKEAGEVVSHGLSRLTPWDMSTRLGQADLFFRAPSREREGRAAAMDWITSFSGPVMGYAVNAYLGVGDVAKGIGSADSGKFLRGVEELTPSVIRHAVKTLRYELEGGVKTRDGHTQLEVDYAEKLGQFFGFGPKRVAEMYENANAIKNTEHQLTQRRKELLDHFASAIEMAPPVPAVPLPNRFPPVAVMF